jgi:hypothetical protein
MSDPYARVNLGKDSSGRPLVINQRTKDMLDSVQKKLAHKLTIVQGSYRGTSGAAASAMTHAKGGVVDIRVWDLGSIPIVTVVKVLREHGFAAWHRHPPTFKDPHIHAVAIGDKELHPQAAEQVIQYKNHQNGLANHGPDEGPRVAFVTWEQFQTASKPAVFKPVFHVDRVATATAHSQPIANGRVLKKELAAQVGRGTMLLNNDKLGLGFKIQWKRWQKKNNVPPFDGIPGPMMLTRLANARHAFIVAR